MSESQAERSVWVTSPSPIALTPVLALSLIAGFFAAPHTRAAAESVVVATLDTVPWTNASAIAFVSAGWAIALLPAVWIAYVMFSYRFTRYELTNQRMKVCRGVLMRRHDEIPLHKINDQRARRPLMGRLFGYGSVILITTDESIRYLEMRMIPDAQEKYESIRRHKLAWKEKIGFREFLSNQTDS